MRLSEHLDKLEAFSMIAETGKINEASKRLNISQPSLTRLVDTLEKVTETKLLTRGRNGSFLTPAGIKLYDYSKTVLEPLKDLERQLKNPLDLNSGFLKIGSYESLAEYLWPDFLSFMQETYPNLDLSIKTTSSHDLLTSLENGHIDLLVDAEPRIVGDVDSFPLYHDYFSFYISKKLIGLDYENLPIIFVPSAFDNENKSLEKYIERSILKKNKKIELDSFNAVKTFCEKGLGVAILPIKLARTSLVSKKIQVIKIKEFPKKFGKHTIYMTIHSNRLQDERIKLLKAELKNFLNS